MARSQETFNKKEKEKKKLQKRKEKDEKREQRKANSKKGKSFEDMIAYVDENGNLTSTPPDPHKKIELKLEDIQLGAKSRDHSEEAEEGNKGRVTYYNQSKGYGFIKDARTKESIFFHLNSVITPVREGDMVSFEMARGPKGMNAVSVTKIP
jgi:cold shock CspA family protein